MIVAEKLYQKFANAKSKGIILEFIVYFDESKYIDITISNGAINNESKYNDEFIGNYYVLWKSGRISYGKISSYALNNFEDFLNHSQKASLQSPQSMYVPERSIYPITLTFSKPLSDILTIPEYFLKIADTFAELQTQLTSSKYKILMQIQEGQRHIYSSQNLDEAYAYTLFRLRIKNHKKTIANLTASELISLNNFDAILTEYGDIITGTDTFLHSGKSGVISSKEMKAIKNIILTPSVFESLLKEQLEDNINAENILRGISKFSTEDVINKKQLYKNLQIEYDPTINYYPGTYKFGNSGEKPHNVAIFHKGRLENPESNIFNYKSIGMSQPTFSINNYMNLRFPNLETIQIQKAYNRGNFLKVPYLSPTSTKEKYNIEHGIVYNEDRKFTVTGVNNIIKLDLLKEMDDGNVTLVQFNKYEVGCLISVK